MTTIRDIDGLLQQLLDAAEAWDGITPVLSKEDATSSRDVVVSDDRFGVDFVNDMLARLSGGTRRLQEIRAVLGFRHNQNAKINQLPEDVLRMIFERCTTPNPDESSIVFTGQGMFMGLDWPPPAFVISWTCSHWRRTALDNSQLWSLIDLANMSQPMVQAMLTRTKECPLLIYFRQSHLSKVKDPQLQLQLVSSDMSRIRELCVTTGYHPAEHEVPTWLSIQAPVIERFSYHPAFHHNIRRIVEGPLFGGCADKLRHLALTHVRMPWQRGLYCNLSTLILRGFDLGAVSPNDSDICCVVQDSPSLGILELFGRKTSPPPPVPAGAPMVHSSTELRASSRRTPCHRVAMTRLRTLVLSLPLRDVYHLLSSMKAEHISLVNIHVNDGVDHSSVDLMTCLFYSDIFPYSSLAGMRVLSATTVDCGGGSTVIRVAQNPLKLVRRGCNIAWTDLCSPPVYTASIRQIAACILAAPEAASVEHVVLSAQASDVGPSFAALTRLPSVYTITLGRGAAHLALSESIVIRAAITILTLRSCTLTSAHVDTLVAQCGNPLERPQKLEFHQVNFQLASVGHIEAVVRAFASIPQLDVEWKSSTFECDDDGRAYRLDCSASDDRQWTVNHNVDGVILSFRSS